MNYQIIIWARDRIMIIIPIANKADAIIAIIRTGIGIEIILGIKKSIIPTIINAIPAANDAILFSIVLKVIIHCSLSFYALIIVIF
jgi:hypothetical protein